MSKNRVLYFFDASLLQAMAFYGVLGVYLLPHYRYQINPDGVSYLGIARKYLSHDFHGAINGYWGPMFSWLLIPFLGAGIEPLLSSRLLSLAIGAATLLAAHSLIKKMDFSKALKNILLFLFSLIIIYYALIVISPDLLFVCLTVAYLSIVLDKSYSSKRYSGVLCGILGSTLYLTKSYGLPFFIFHFVLINGCYLFRVEDPQIRTAIIKKFLAGMALFALISGIWISLISEKYGYLTIGTTGHYNYAIAGPDSLGHPLLYGGLFAPPDPAAISAWEDPGYIKVKDWNLFGSLASIKHQVRNTLRICLQIFYIFNSFSLFTFGLLLAAIVYFIQRGKSVLFDNAFYLFLTSIVLILGYLLVLVEERYLWIDEILFVLIGGKLLSLLFQNALIKPLSKIILVLFFIVSFSKMPINKLYSNMDTGKSLFNLNQELRDLNIQGRVASDSNWHETLYLSFYNDWKDYGVVANLGESEIKTELKNNEIDYLFIWDTAGSRLDFVQNLKEITEGKIKGLKIYQMR